MSIVNKHSSFDEIYVYNLWILKVLCWGSHAYVCCLQLIDNGKHSLVILFMNVYYL